MNSLYLNECLSMTIKGRRLRASEFVSRIGSVCFRTYFAVHGVDDQQVKIWSLDDYVMSIYTLTITECEV